MLGSSKLFALFAIPVAALAFTPTPAHADWRGGGYGYRGGYGGGYGGYHGGYGYRGGYGRGYGIGPFVGGALLGLGVGSLLAAPYYAPPQVVYAPPPVYYPPPAYAAYPPPGYAAYPPPGYAAYPPAYYRPPGY